MVDDAAAYWNSSTNEVQTGFWRDAALGDRVAVLIRHRQLYPAVIRPVPGAPDHGLWLQNLIVLGDRQTVAHGCDTADPLHAGSFEVALLGADERSTVLDRLALRTCVPAACRGSAPAGMRTSRSAPAASPCGSRCGMAPGPDDVLRATSGGRT